MEEAMNTLQFVLSNGMSKFTSFSTMLGNGLTKVIKPRRKEGNQLVGCTIHIPCEYPDGTKIATEKIESFLQMYDQKFGGSSVLGIFDGRWVDEGKTIKEPMYRVEVALPIRAIPIFKEIALKIGKETLQKCMYILTPQPEFLTVD
jgi:hypothetical protein